MMKKLILFIIFFIYSTNNSNAVLDDEDPHKISDDYISKLEYCNILNGLSPNQKTLPFSNIAILETSPYPNIKLEPEELQQKVIYGIDAIEDTKQISHHTQTICIILNQLISTINFVFSDSAREMKKNNCNIINMSCGIIDDNKLLDKDTQKFLEKAFSKDSEQFITIIAKYVLERKGDGIEECISEGLPDEYFLEKHFKTLESLIKNKELSDFNQFFKKLSKTITESFNMQRNFTTQFLNGDFLVIQSLANGKGILNIDNCSFNNVETGSFERENIIFARNLYLYQETDYITPQSEIPSENFANRTLCAVTPSNSDNDYNRDISGNSFAAPIVSACALMIEATLKQKELPPLLPSEIAQCLLKTAKRIFLPTPDDQLEIEGVLYSKTYGAGIIQMDDAINFAVNLANEKKNKID